MALGLTITTQGRDDLALAVAQSDSLTLSNIILTNAYTSGTASTVQTASDLGGQLVATMPTNGRRIATGKVQVEGSDNGSNAYEAKTLALVYSKDGQTRVFAYHTSATTFIYKVADTAVMVSAAIAIEDSQASSITFSNVTLSFPTATTSAKGAVKLAESLAILNPPAVVSGDPIVPQAQDVSSAFTVVLGNGCFDSGNPVSLKKSLSVGTNDLTTDSYATSDFTQSGNYYDASYHGGASIDPYAFIRGNAYWEMGSVSGWFALSNVSSLYYVIYLINSSRQMIGVILRNNSNNYYIRLMNQPTSTLILKTVEDRTHATIARTIDAHKVSANVCDAEKVVSGGDTQIFFDSSSFYQTETSGTYRYKNLINLSLVRGAELNIPTMTIGGTVVSGVYSSSARMWSHNGRTYTYDYNSNTLSCSGGTPQAGNLSYKQNGLIDSAGEVKAYGLELSKCGHIAMYKGLLSKASASANTTLSSVFNYRMSVSLTSDILTIGLSPSGTPLVNNTGANGSFAEIICGDTVFDSGTKDRKLFPLSGAYGTYTTCALPAAKSNVPLLIKIY